MMMIFRDTRGKIKLHNRHEQPTSRVASRLRSPFTQIYTLTMAKSSRRHHAKVSKHKDKRMNLSNPSLVAKPKGRPGRSENAITPGYNLQKAMGLEDDGDLYLTLLVRLNLFFSLLLST